LILRGSEIKRITIFNRSAERSRLLLTQVRQENQQRWKSAAEFDTVETGQPDYETALSRALAQADIVFCTTPSGTPLFPARYVTAAAREDRGCFISGVGSWQASMMEIDPERPRSRPGRGTR